MLLTSPESIRGLSCPELTDSVEPVEMGGEVYVRGAALRGRESEDGKEGKSHQLHRSWTCH